MELSGGLAHAYELRSEDTLIEWIEGDRKRVKRQITSSFWFIREILRYGKDCKVLSPPELTLRVGDHFAEAAKLYE
jgi:predicted DNA-binding transcriptional regulator YafY